MKPSVTFVINSLELGGAERVLSSMANYWARDGWSVSILTMRENEQPFYELDPRVTKVCLHLASRSQNLWHALTNNIRRVRAIRAFVKQERPDVVISFMAATNVVALLATRFTGTAVLVSERTLPSRSAIDPIWRTLRRLTYPHADRVIVQSTTARDELSPAVQDKATVIANPVNFVAAAGAGAVRDDGRPFILAVGRLEAVKRLDHLIAAFATVAPEHPSWRLVLVGDGGLRDELGGLVSEHGLSNRIELPGAVADPFKRYRGAGLYVICSEYEGMPNALLEAMANGLPVLSYDSPGGIRDIVVNGENGILVPSGDRDALAGAIAALLADPEKRSSLGRAALEVNERFSIDRVMRQWQHECHAAINKKAAPCPQERTT